MAGRHRLQQGGRHIPMRYRQMLKDAATLIGGNAWAQAIGMLSYLLLARLFTSEEFGVYNVFYSYIEVLVILSTCKYEMAVVRADGDREAAAVARFALRMNTIISLGLLTAIGVLVACDALPGKSATLGLVALLIPVMVFFSGTSRVYAALLNRWRLFRPIAASEVVTSTSGALVKVAIGALKTAQVSCNKWLGMMGMPVGTVLGKMCGNINYALRVRRLRLPVDLSAAEVRAAAAKHRNFALFTMPKEWVSSFSYNLPLLWLGYYFGKAELGLFALAMTVCLRPVNVLNGAFERMLYVRTAQRVRDRKHVARDLCKFVGVVQLAALPVLALLFLFAEPLFRVLFGEQWVGCAYYVRCLVPWVFVSISSASLSFVAAVFGRQRGEFLLFLALLGLRVAALWVGIEQDSFSLAILLFSAASAAMGAVLLAWYLLLARRHDRYL